MTEPSQPTPRDLSRLAVGRLTKLIAAAAVAATAAFGVAAASAGKHAATATVDQSSASVSSDTSPDGSYDDGFSLAPSQGVYSTGQAPSATSGGS